MSFVLISIYDICMNNNSKCSLLKMKLFYISISNGWSESVGKQGRLIPLTMFNKQVTDFFMLSRFFICGGHRKRFWEGLQFMKKLLASTQQNTLNKHIHLQLLFISFIIINQEYCYSCMNKIMKTNQGGADIIHHIWQSLWSSYKHSCHQLKQDK